MNCKDALKKTANAIGRCMDEQARGKRRSPAFLAAVFMDPRHFNYVDETQVATARTHLVQLWSRMEVIKKRQKNLLFSYLIALK